MPFDLDKKNTLRKLILSDKSKKGSVDEKILPLVNLINKHKNYYTTSSCSGRIQLIIPSEDGKKYEARWLLSSHEPVKLKELQEALKDLPKETIWFKMEPPILHVCARNMDTAGRLLKISNDSGFRRSGIISFRKRIIIEIMIPEKIDAPIAEKGRLIVSKDYLKAIIKHANSRLIKTRKRLKKFEKALPSQ